MSVIASTTVSIACSPPLVTAARSSSSVSIPVLPSNHQWTNIEPLTEQPAQQLRRRVAMLLHDRTGDDRITGQDRLDDPGVLRIGVIEVAAQDGDRAEQLVEA